MKLTIATFHAQSLRTNERLMNEIRDKKWDLTGLQEIKYKEE